MTKLAEYSDFKILSYEEKDEIIDGKNVKIFTNIIYKYKDKENKLTGRFYSNDGGFLFNLDNRINIMPLDAK